MHDPMNDRTEYQPRIPRREPVLRPVERESTYAERESAYREPVRREPAYREEIHEEDDVEQVQAWTRDPHEERRRQVQKGIQGIYLVFGIVEALLAIRFILRALGANPQADFAAFIYALTAPFVAPFVDLFASPQSAGGMVLESHTIVAFLVYALLAWLIAKVVWLIFGDTRTETRTSTRSYESYRRR